MLQKVCEELKGEASELQKAYTIEALQNRIVSNKKIGLDWGEQNQIQQSLKAVENLIKELDNLLSNLNPETTQSKLKEYLRQWARLVLDLTFVFENHLFEEDLPGRSQVEILISELRKIQSLSQHYYHDAIHQTNNRNLENNYLSVIEVMGADIAGTLYWRLGAVFYMYCHCIIHSSSFDPDDLTQDLQSGIFELKRMLLIGGFNYPGEEQITKSTEGTGSIPAIENDLPEGLEQQLKKALEKHEDNNDFEPNLVDQGLPSSTHVLALMYNTELYYWLWKHGGNSTQNTKEETKGIGKILAEKYINALKSLPGWDASRARQILAEFNQ